MTTEIQVDFSGLGVTNVETGDPITGFQTMPIGYTQLVINGASPIPLGTQNPTLQQIADSIPTSLSIDTVTIAQKLIQQGFQSVGNALQFADLGFWVRVYFNTPSDYVNKIEWQSTTMQINQETGEIITDTADPEHIFVTINEVYEIAYSKTMELINQYKILA